MFAAHTGFVLWAVIFLFVWTFYTVDSLWQKKRINKALSPNSLNSYYFFIFSFKGLSFKTPFKIEF